jgi:diguanylate cyclase (GGDEF)-like protein
MHSGEESRERSASARRAAPSRFRENAFPVPVRILLIDDNLPDRVRYRRMLQRVTGDYEIMEAEDGTQGLQMLDAELPFACVLLDQDLPDLQGLDVLEDIRERPNPPPVVMLTGEEDAAVSIEALRRGAADYLMKRRIDEDRLLRAIQGAIERSALARRLRDNEQRLTRFYRLANQTEDALFIVDAATARVTECNEAARHRLQLVLSDGDAVSQPAAFASAESWQEFCRRVLAEGSASYEWHSQQADGSAATVEILARCIEEEGTPYIVAVGRDISVRKVREQDLIERSLRDGLTGVWNRRAFDEHLVEYWREAARRQRPLAVVMIDVDQFKAYNDSAGHPAGDDCLRRVAQALRSGAPRDSSILARYGGEEFALLIEDADAQSAQVVAERLRQAVIALALPHPSSTVSASITASIGVASRVPSSEHDDTRTLVIAADAALYRAKQAGRNTVAMDGV